MENNIYDVEKKKKTMYNVPAVDNAFKILTLLSRKKFSKSNLTEISKALSLTQQHVSYFTTVRRTFNCSF